MRGSLVSAEKSSADIGAKRDRTEAIQCAFRLLSYRDRSEKELGERLARKGFSEGAVRSAVQYLKEKGFVDDSRIAVSLKRSAQETKLLGIQGVRRFLRHRGITEEIIDDVLSDDNSDEITRAKEVIKKKLRTMGNYSGAETRKKLWNLLVRKGYSFDTIMQTLKHLNIDIREDK